jgi:hypothetical protein
METADDLELRWVHLDASQAGAGSMPDAPAGGSSDSAGDGSEGPDEQSPGVGSHDLSNAVTAIVGAARLLCDRWDELAEPERKELAAMVLRRADGLRRALDARGATS